MTNINDVLHSLFIASTKAYSESKCRYPQWGYQNLDWYIATGRASNDFLKAIAGLSDRRKITLVQKASVGSASEAVDIAKRYLKISSDEI